ncbi:MAG TPA: hypothetical protein VK135_08380 [Candidatus Dormibacteraeota bacterium]|nr:hypothetical protein [Candidatus Dormibacteraeota bacterium]
MNEFVINVVGGMFTVIYLIVLVTSLFKYVSIYNEGSLDVRDEVKKELLKKCIIKFSVLNLSAIVVLFIVYELLKSLW